MNMDDVHREMLQFRAALLDFNTHLGEALNNLETQHAEIEESVTHVEFLNSKLDALDRYLHGG